MSAIQGSTRIPDATQPVNQSALNPDHRDQRWSRGCKVLVAAAAYCVLAMSAHADQILETYNASLTTYLYTSKSAVQDVRPLAIQRGVGLDGSRVAGGLYGAALNGDPFGQATYGGKRSLSGVNLATGAFAIAEVDLALPAPGGSGVVIGRSYNARQKDSGSSYFVSTGYQGNNWFQLAQPEISLYEGATDDLDVLYLNYGADRYIELKRYDASSTEFKSKNGAAGAVQFTAGATDEPDEYTYTDQHGMQYVFFGFDADAGAAAGQFWRKTDPAGNTLYVGDATTGSTAITNGFNGSGQITKLYDGSSNDGRRYTFAYTSGLLAQVKAEAKTGGTWASPTGVFEVAKVDYTYYGISAAYGSEDDLETVVITRPMTDSGVNLIQKKYYRYWTGTYNATTNPGHASSLQYIVAAEGYRQADWADSTFDDDPLNMTESSLKPYATAYFEYDTDHRINKVWFNGECGCSGGSNGEHTITYGVNGSHPGNAAYDEEWLNRAVVKQPDNVYFTQYIDEVGQSLSTVVTDSDPSDSPTKTWATEAIRNSSGQVNEIRTPAANSSYTHSTGAFSANASSGLVNTFTRETTGDLKGFFTDVKWKEGTSGTAYFDGSFTNTSRTLIIGDVGVTRPLIVSSRVYSEKISSGTSGSYLTSLGYTYHSATTTDVKYITHETITLTNPTVSTANNGSGTATTSMQYFNDDGTRTFIKGEDASIAYSEYTDGQLTKRVRDADTTKTGSGEDFENVTIPTGFESSGTPFHWVTSISHNSRAGHSTTRPSGDVNEKYYTTLVDRRVVSISIPRKTTGGIRTYYGPVKYVVSNHARDTEVKARIYFSGGSTTIALTSWIDETKSDAIEAVSTGTVTWLRTDHYSETGSTLEESRGYFDIPGSPDYLPGTDGTHYDSTTYAYDDMGRRMRTAMPTGDRLRVSYDELGRITQSSSGTNDNGETGGDTSGTNNIVITTKYEYDDNSDGGNSLLTKQTLDADGNWGGTSDQHVKAFEYDSKGNLIVVTNPQSPHTLNKVDNLGRIIATGLYSSSSGLDILDDPSTLATDRLALSKTLYDEMGRLWKSQVHKIDAVDGSDDDNLQRLTWYDDVGRAIKFDGHQLVKTIHDRLGRVTHRFTLADIDDSTYSDADDVSGDIVLNEQQMVYDDEKRNQLWMTVSIDRSWDDFGGITGETAGALDTNADADDLLVTAANLEGRGSITGRWYDTEGRLTDTVQFGTYGGSDFDRDGMTVPARSDTALRSTTAYNDDGTLQSVTDPMDLETRFTYDDAGRQVVVINNYVNGTPSGATGDDDIHIRYVYTNGLQTKMWTDEDGDGTEDAADQVTLYIFGTTKGATAGLSDIATGNLLRAVVYPDSTNTGTTVTAIDSDDSDVVSYAYNSQGGITRIENQLANVLEMDYDTGGRLTHQRATAVTGVDTAVLRKSWSYNNLSRVETLTQYDNATVGSGNVVDEIKYTRASTDWGYVTKFEQDHNSTVTTGGDYLYDIDYTYTKRTIGRNTVRRTGMDLPDGSTITYLFANAGGGGSGDNDASRVSSMLMNSVTLARYKYLGVGTVVDTDYPEPDIFSKVSSSTSGSYPGLDRFNRMTTSSWTWDLSTDKNFYDVDVSYNRSSNITRTEDNVHTAGAEGSGNGQFDVLYSLDNLNRVTRAKEGHWDGSNITDVNATRDESWTLEQFGNWELYKRDLDGDLNYNETDELNDDRTHNIVNEVTARDTDDNGTDNYTLTYNAVGNLTDDDESYKYTYNAWGCLTEVKNQSDQTVTQYRYNGLDHRITWKYDTDADGDVDSNDKTYHFAYDDRWRIVATYRETDSSPKEQFVYHNAGFDGFGGSSYIDTIVLRDKDANTSWMIASDGTLEDRVYYCQNWRGDVSVLVDTDTTTGAGNVVEWVKYSSYGTPFGLPKGDANSDGILGTADVIQILNWSNASTYDQRGDMDGDGDVDGSDVTAASNASPITLGRGVLSDVGNRRGYAGYEWDGAITVLYHVRNRVLNTELGRWTTRDPVGIAAGMNLYAYLNGLPIQGVDPSGLLGQGAQSYPPPSTARPPVRRGISPSPHRRRDRPKQTPDGRPIDWQKRPAFLPPDMEVPEWYKPPRRYPGLVPSIYDPDAPYRLTPPIPGQLPLGPIPNRSLNPLVRKPYPHSRPRTKPLPIPNPGDFLQPTEKKAKNPIDKCRDDCAIDWLDDASDCEREFDQLGDFCDENFSNWEEWNDCMDGAEWEKQICLQDLSLNYWDCVADCLKVPSEPVKDLESGVSLAKK